MGGGVRCQCQVCVYSPADTANELTLFVMNGPTPSEHMPFADWEEM